MIKLEMSSVPMSFIPPTIVTAVSSASSALNQPVRIPVPLAKFSSNVTEKIR